jgi:hypothetical protein
MSEDMKSIEGEDRADRQQRHNWLWKAKTFETVDNPCVKTQHNSGVWSVTVGENNLAWGYRINLSSDAQAYIMWRSTIKIARADKGVSPGLAFHDSKAGLLFQVSAARNSAELCLLKVNKEATLVESFPLSYANCPFWMVLDYNAITGLCSGKVGEAVIFERRLPYKNIPSMCPVTCLEIMTVSDSYGSGGSVEFGDLALECD